MTKKRLTKDNAICPACGAKGQGVKAITLRSLLRPEKQTLIGNCRYFFCNSPRCEIVYFTEGGSRIFSKEDLVVRVGVKEVSSPRPVCYCFGYSVEDIFSEVERSGKSTLVNEITWRIKEEGCSCESKNPAGSCCLGTVHGYVREAYARFGIEESASQVNNEVQGYCGPDSCCK